ncbi:hypothetical protein CHLRE_03g193576v5 [Chlamydomonas reinhardtii]|uniref:Uncharacterized protein n=1 Tax=Chlamydomonas reinhardtii TaxID=3055 RepID=A0A2K3DYH0_CHLRE|nr:uncharacterized protein CHLRE_03g193576v5 [Chlamydomonas reinhardtii]PNW85582.1 hypothetical protein CHLRE_03g193576v5 [Chlamydomonas reinhardtii]
MFRKMACAASSGPCYTRRGSRSAGTAVVQVLLAVIKAATANLTQMESNYLSEPVRSPARCTTASRARATPTVAVGREWQHSGSLREYFIRCLEHPDCRMGRGLFIAVLQQVPQLLHKLSHDEQQRAYLLQRGDEQGHVTLSDVDGAGLLEEGLLRTTQLTLRRAV